MIGDLCPNSTGIGQLGPNSRRCSANFGQHWFNLCPKCPIWGSSDQTLHSLDDIHATEADVRPTPRCERHFLGGVPADRTSRRSQAAPSSSEPAPRRAQRQGLPGAAEGWAHRIRAGQPVAGRPAGGREHADRAARRERLGRRRLAVHGQGDVRVRGDIG